VDAQPIHVLLVEDNPGDARFVREMVREVPDLSIHHVERLATAIEHLATQKVDVVLLDLGLPDSQGLETLRTVIKTGGGVPVVVLTGHDDEAVGRAAVRDGAQDYLVKGQVAGQALTRAVRYAIERKGAEQALMESEARFRMFTERTPDGVFSVDNTGRYTQANGSACRITGYSKDELLQMSIQELLAEESLEDGLDHFRRLMETGAATSDLWHKRKDGSTCCLTVDAVKLSDTQVQGFCKDITARKQAEEALRISEERFRMLFETMAQGVVFQNESGAITSANPAAGRILGLTLDQMQGRTSMDPRWKAVHEDGSGFPADAHPAMEALRTGRTIGSVVMGVFNPALESVRWISIHATPLFKPSRGEPTGVYAVFDDITERKQAEARMAEQLDELRRWHQATLGREGRVLDLKKEVNELLATASQPPRYASALEEK
jgi:PAS domain S-box-containing protein